MTEPQHVSGLMATHRATYDAWASDYVNRTWDMARFPGLAADLERFMSRVDEGGSVLDVGCGSGRDVAYLSAQFSVTGVDASWEILKQARIRFPRIADQLVQADIVALPFRDGQFDGIWCSGVLVHVPRQQAQAALDEIRRAMTVGGIVALSMKSGSSQGWVHSGQIEGRRWMSHWNPEEFARVVEAAGYESVVVELCAREPWFIVSARAA